LVVNAGSSSLKLRVLDPADAVTASADLPAPGETAPGGAADASQIKSAIESLGPVDARPVTPTVTGRIPIHRAGRRD
jgi:hypothetical protein